MFDFLFKKPEPPKPQWNHPECIDHGQGVFSIPIARLETIGYQTARKEFFGELLARFITKHPNLEIQLICPVDEGNWTEWMCVLTKPRPAHALSKPLDQKS